MKAFTSPCKECVQISRHPGTVRIWTFTRERLNGPLMALRHVYLDRRVVRPPPSQDIPVERTEDNRLIEEVRGEKKRREEQDA